MFKSINEASLILGKVITSRKDAVIKVQLTEDEKKVVSHDFNGYCEAVRIEYEGWRIFPGYDKDLNKDFPEADQEYDFVLIPGYDLSDETLKLLTQLAKKLFPEDWKLGRSGFYDVLHESYNVARVSLTVRELLEPYLNMEEIAEETFATLSDDLLNQIVG